MKIIHTFKILHEGWEMDNDGRVVEDEVGGNKIMTTSHGVRCEMSQTSLKAKIKETEASLAGLKKAKELVYGSRFRQKET